MHNQRFFTMAEAYDRLCQTLVPQYDWFQEEALRIAELSRFSRPVVVDLGAGSGIFLERVLERWPDAHAYWMDYSDDVQRVARARLQRFGERVCYVQAALDSHWEPRIHDAPSLVFSMSAIHHLTSEEKRALYSRCCRLLAPGGWFLNVDEMQTLDRGAYLRSLLFWLRHVEDCQTRIPSEDWPYYERFGEHMENWRARNVVGFDHPKAKGDDLHEGFPEQVRWLQDIGYLDVDLFAKYHLWCMIGGRKPESAQEGGQTT